MTAALPDVTAMQVLRLEPGDHLLVTVADPRTAMADIVRVRDELVRRFGVPVTVVAGATVAVVRKAQR